MLAVRASRSACRVQPRLRFPSATTLTPENLVDKVKQHTEDYDGTLAHDGRVDDVTVDAVLPDPAKHRKSLGRENT